MVSTKGTVEMFIKIVLKIAVILGRTDTLILSLQINEHRISPFI